MSDMIGISGKEDVVPHWDVALAGLLRDEYARAMQPLRLAGLQQLAVEHGVRFDDLVVTLFQLCIHREWRYRNPDGVQRLITPAVLNGLCRRGRLHGRDFKDYTGGWRPVD